jgi:hypothetical protein
MDPSQEIKPSRPAWTRREVLPWLAVALLAAGIFVQHRRLEEVSRNLHATTEAAERAAEKRMIDRLAPLKERVDQAELQVRGCIAAIEKSGR